VNAEQPKKAPWVDDDLTVDDSPMSGKGLFAIGNIEVGRVVMRLGRRLVSTSDLEELVLTSSEYVDTLTVFEDVHLVLPSSTKVHFGNHSCAPNVWHVGPYEIAARRPIEAGEEVTMTTGRSLVRLSSQWCARVEPISVGG
jgi:uncharacterized protein